MLVLIGAGILLVSRDALSQRRLRPWATAGTWTIVGVAISLPPVIVLGGWHVATPIGLLHVLLPATGPIRASARLGVVGLIGLAMLTGLAFAEVHRLLAARASVPGLGTVASMVVALLYLSTLVEATASGALDTWPRGLIAAPTVPPSFVSITCT